MRADAARNAQQILRAARQSFAEVGPDVTLEEIARRAGVGPRTLYRRFPSKEDLVRAALDQTIDENISPAIELALADRDPLRGFTTVLEAAVAVVIREHHTLIAGNHSGALTVDVAAPFFESLAELTRRAQAAGQVRGDLVPEDLPRIIGMLVSVLWTMDPQSEGWRRYLRLVLDMLTSPAASPLPPAVPMVSVLLRDDRSTQ